MKRPFTLCLCGAGLFAAGYVVRGFSPPSSGDAAPAASAARPAGNLTVRSLAAAGAHRDSAEGSSVRPFTPGRPFVRTGAREWILELLSGMEGDRRGTAVAMAASLQSFMTMDDESVREVVAALEDLISAADLKNPDRRRNPNGDGTLDRLLELSMMRLAQTNPEEALSVLRKHFSLNDGDTCLLVFGTLAVRDALRAERLALTMEASQQRDALKAVMYALINRDPEAALSLAARHSEIAGDKYREGILKGWVLRDPEAAMAAAVREMSASQNPGLIRSALREWSGKDPAAAARWAEAHEGPGRVAARAMVLEMRVRGNPQAVLEEYTALRNTGGDVRELGHLTSALADALAAKDVATARAWAENLPDSESRKLALHQVTEEWVKRDAPAASEWIRALPPGDLRDDSVRELSNAIARSDPSGAFEWARSIADPQLRTATAEGVIRTWRESDPEAANAASASLPADKQSP